MDGKRAVVLFMLGTVAVVSVDHVTRGELPPPRRFIGPLIAYLFLAFLAEPAPQVAGPLAGLVFFAVALERGGAFDRLRIGGQ